MNVSIPFYYFTLYIPFPLSRIDRHRRIDGEIETGKDKSKVFSSVFIMENFGILDTEAAFISVSKLKGEVVENECSIGNGSRKGLSDITHLQQQPVVLTQSAKLLLRPASLRRKYDPDESSPRPKVSSVIDFIWLPEVIELTGIELQELRINLEKFQQ
ncbi:hypothetical protein PTKIN_Ptkin13bG0202000 [Pterospermum kingtungense]